MYCLLCIFARFIMRTTRSICLRAITCFAIDDIILATEYEELHYKIIEVIFYICTQYGPTLKPGKCATGYDCIEYLGNMVFGKATWPTPHRVKALVNMALPTTITELLSFLGAMGFVRTFMPHYSQVSSVTRCGAPHWLFDKTRSSANTCAVD